MLGYLSIDTREPDTPKIGQGVIDRRLHENSERGPESLVKRCLLVIKVDARQNRHWVPREDLPMAKKGGDPGIKKALIELARGKGPLSA